MMLLFLRSRNYGVIFGEVFSVLFARTVRYPPVAWRMKTFCRPYPFDSRWQLRHYYFYT